jgi:carboxylesterase
MVVQRIIPTAEPFFFPGDRTGCLLVHGFTGTPKEMRWMGEYLAAQGHTVLGIRLAGHATQPKDILRTTWEDWLTSVEDGLDLLRPITSHLYIIGLSMGGSLSLLAAARYPVDGVVTMSAPLALPPDWRMRYLNALRVFVPEVDKGKPDWHNPAAAVDHIDYPKYPTRSVGQMLQLLDVLQAELPKVRVPVMLVHSRQDKGVLPENMQNIYDRLQTTHKEMLWVDDSGHVIPREPERQRVFAATEDFIQRINSGQV